MQSDISTLTIISLKLEYTEILNLVKGGVIFKDIILKEDPYDRCDDEKTQITIKINESSMKHLEFMKVYLENRDRESGVKFGST